MNTHERLLIEKDIQMIERSIPAIRHAALFGSALSKRLIHANDIDVLFLYDGCSFADLKEKILAIPTHFPIYPIYLNTNYNKSNKVIGDPIGYHMILMPLQDPCEQFLKRHIGNMEFIGKKLPPEFSHKAKLTITSAA